MSSLLGGKVIDSLPHWCFLVLESVVTVRLYDVSLGRQEFSLRICCDKNVTNVKVVFSV